MRDLHPFPAPRPTLAALAVAAALVVAGCSQSRPVAATQTLESLVAAPAVAGWTALAPDAALLHLPDGADRAAGLRERRTTRGAVQEIELPASGGTGRNLLTIALHGEAVVDSLYPGKPSQAGIKVEIAAAFPGRTLRILQQPRRNAFGPYGLAVAADPNRQRCIYAWQWLDRDDRRVGDRLGGSASWRARICSKARTLDEIAAALDQIALGPAPDGVAAPRPVKAKAVRNRPAPATRRVLPSEPAPALPGPAPSGLRYLAAIPTGVTSSRVGGAPPSLDRSLPPEAYRGPIARVAPLPRQTMREAAGPPRGIVPGPD